MMNNSTMQLYHYNILLGALTRYGYETPWASAWLIAREPTIIPQYAAVDAFLRWNESLPDDLPVAESDAHYEQELAARGLDEEFMKRFWSGWNVHMPNGEIRKISLSSFEEDGYLTWRW